MKNNNRLEHADDILSFCRTLSILYIEDDKAIREHTEETLEMIFGTISIALNGEEGLKQYIQYYNEHGNYVDIVLTDLKLPALSGVEMSKEMLRLNQEQLIIVNSGYNQVEVLTHLIDLGIYYFLPKPLTFKHLYQTLQKVASHIYEKQKNINNVKEIESLQKLLNESDDSRQNQNKIIHTLSKDIKMSAEAIEDLVKMTCDITLDKKEKGYLEKIKNSGGHIFALAKNIEEISMSESDEIVLEDIEFNINNIFDNISTTIVAKAYQKGLTVIFDINNNVPAIIKGDPLRLSQVLMILMTNAVTYTQSGDIILKVKMSPLPKKDKLLIFEVVDHGIGLTKDEQKNILKQEKREKKSSLGIAKDIVKMMGGTIRIKSQYGVGSRFIFSIVTQQVDERSYRLPSKSLMSKKVLIVDTNPKSSLALAQMLQYFRYDTKISFDLQEANRLFLEDTSFDIICMDRNFMTQIEDEAFMSDTTAKIILIEDNILQQNRNVNNSMQIDSKIYKPYTQKMIFDMIVSLYGDEHGKDDKEILTKKEIQNLSGSHILLIEYKTIIQNSIQTMLEDTGIKLTMTQSAEEALSLSKKLIDLDMILMDVQPLLARDIEVITEIEQSSRYANTPKVALLTDDSPESLEELKKKSFIDHITKPIVPHELYRVLKNNITPKAKATLSKDIVPLKNKERPIIIDNGKNYYDLKDTKFTLCEDKKRFEEFKVVAKSSDLKIKALLKINRRSRAIELLESVRKASANICATTLEDTISYLMKTIDINSEESYLIIQRFSEYLEIVMQKIEKIESNNEN